MTQKVFIGVDDTDFLGSPVGTGRFARGMADYLETLGSGCTVGVIRYQLLVDQRIQYTSHNSAKCIEFESEITLRKLHRNCMEYIKQNLQTGSDPGLCTCAEVRVSRELIEFGELAQKEFITKEQAVQLAGKSGVLLSELGGTGDGIIGALAAVGLRGSGNGGRYVQLRGIREITGMVTPRYLLAETGIAAVIDDNGKPVDGDEIIDSQGWIKPNVLGGKPVLRVHLKSNDNGGNRIWETIEKKHKKKREEKEMVL